jgi:hypothetical protein
MIQGLKFGNDAGRCKMMQNTSATCQQSDTPLTRDCSLPVLAKQLARHRPTIAPDKRPLLELLINQISNFERSPDGMRPLILRTIDRIENAA